MTSFSTVMPGTLVKSQIPCAVAFGSSNDTAQLRIRQSDGLNSGMWMPTTGTLNQNFDGPLGTGNGKFLLPIGAGGDYAYTSVLQDDGKILLTGYCFNGADDDFCAASLDQGGRFDDYVTGGGSDRDFASGSGTSFFATCLHSATGGAIATWGTSTSCASSDSSDWHALPAAYEKIAYTTALEPDPADATANLYFALRAATNQPPGTYIAPITFNVIAPNT